MSIRVMTLVWDNFPRGGSEKLVLLALADWCDDQGGSLYPSIGAIAKKTCLSEKQARRIVHDFIKEKLLSVVANKQGGEPGTTRRYRLDISKLTPPADGRAPADGRGDKSLPTPPADVPDGSRRCPSTAPAGGSQSVIRTINKHQEGAPVLELVDQKPKPAKKRGRAAQPEHTFATFLARCEADSVAPVPADDAVFSYADSVGLSRDLVALAWAKFKAEYATGTKAAKRYSDWRATFRNAVRDCWCGYWAMNEQGEVFTTSKGRMARREFAGALAEQAVAA
jgi:hypothetical protein